MTRYRLRSTLRIAFDNLLFMSDLRGLLIHAASFPGRYPQEAQHRFCLYALRRKTNRDWLCPGETCLETTSGKQMGRKGHDVIVPDGVPMSL